MRIDLERILFHANERLGSIETGLGRDHLIDLFKGFLKVENERLRIRHRFGIGGIEVARGRSYLVDLVICRVSSLVANELDSSHPSVGPCSIIALGGYGRRELAPSSDVDLLVLHAGGRNNFAESYVEQILRLLWDIGLTVGHSFRSLSDCVEMARSDLHSTTAMTEARLVAGNPSLFRRFVRELNRSVYRNRHEAGAFLEAIGREMEARYQRFGAAVCVQEPHIKSGAGGLRDLHTALWVGHAVYGLSRLDDLRAEDAISGAEYASSRRAYDFVSRVRNEAHFLTGRATDLLSLDLQPQVAAGLGYEAKRGLLASEIFMRDYYQRAQELNDFCASFLSRSTARRRARRDSTRMEIAASYEVRQGRLYLTTRKRRRLEQGVEAQFEISDDRLHIRNEPQDFRSNPARMMEVFAVAQSEGVTLSEETRALIRGNLSLVSRAFRSSKEASILFIEMLRRKGRVASTLRLMHETGFLSRLIPEFGRISFLVQHDFYHKYTIDEHTLKAIEAIDRLDSSFNERLAPLGQVFAEIDDTAPLYLGMLLHDIGKGEGSGHVLKGVRKAEMVCQRLGLDEQSANQVLFLVRQHLLMAQLSQRRDLSEERLIEDFAATVGSLDRLNSLLLLTYGDINGVGPGVWNDWKASLLWELYSRSRSFLADGNVKWNHVIHITESVTDELGGNYSTDEIEHHLSLLPERYIRAASPAEIASHLRLIERLAVESLCSAWRAADDGEWTELTIATSDSAGLFARLAGTLTASGLNILSADIYTREDGIALDMFRVCEASSHLGLRPERWGAVEKNLRAAVEGDYDVEAAVERRRAKAMSPTRRNRYYAEAKPSVRFDHFASSVCTVIEVEARDETGLAYRISSTLSALGLQIRLARIGTEKSLALDVFYVTDLDGARLTPSRMEMVEGALMGALGESATEKNLKRAV